MCLPRISVTFSDLILFGSDIQSSLEPRKFLGKFLILVLGPTTYQATSGFGFEVEAEIFLRVVVRVGEVGTRTPATGRRFGVRRHRVHRAHRYFELSDFQKRKESFSENFFKFKFVSLFHFMSAFDVSRCFVSKLSKSRRSRVGCIGQRPLTPVSGIHQKRLIGNNNNNNKSSNKKWESVMNYRRCPKRVKM